MTGGLVASLDVARGDFHLVADLAAPPGAVVALLGANGAGKSTALDAIAGVLPLDAGRIAVDGEVLDDPASGVLLPPERRPVGLVQQRPSLFPHLTVRANVAYGLRAAGEPRRQARQRAEAALAGAGLADLADRRPSSLSGGQAARVALVRALVRAPRLLLLDEPLASIDAASRPGLRETIREALGAYSGAAILVTHDPADAESLADEVVVLDAGRIADRRSSAGAG